MKRFIITIVFITTVLNLVAQNGSINIHVFLKIINSSLSTTSNVITSLDYTLQYVKKDDSFNNSKDIAWAYNMSYLKSIDKWEIPKDGYFSYLKILFLNKKMDAILYGFNDKKIYEHYYLNLYKYGYMKYNEEISLETNSIIVSYINQQENATIWLQEMANKDDISYIVSWTTMD